MHNMIAGKRFSFPFDTSQLCDSYYSLQLNILEHFLAHFYIQWIFLCSEDKQI